VVQRIQLATPALVHGNEHRVDRALADGANGIGDGVAVEQREPTGTGGLDAAALVRPEDRSDEGWPGGSKGIGRHGTLRQRPQPF
jgi:hypothetical protein